MKPRLIVEQKITAFANQYSIYHATETGEKGDLLAFAHQKRMAFKEKVDFFTDTSKTQLAFVLQAEKTMDVHGKFFVRNANGDQLGQFRKEFKKSLISSTWSILDSKDTPLLQITESNKHFAVARRTVGFIPFIGEIADIITSFIRFHFRFIDVKTGQDVGFYRKTTRFYDHYLLTLDDKTWEQQNPQTLAAMAVALDALQSR